jgi:hypothetical protein
MWLVKLGLRRPYTLAVVAILLFVLGGITIQHSIDWASGCPRRIS